MNNTQKIFDHWNTLNLIGHREIERFKSTISARLKHYTVGEIISAMDNYAEIVMSPDYYFTYKWTLKDWLLRGLDKFLSENKPHNRYKNKYGSPYKAEDMNNKQAEYQRATPEERVILENKWKEELRK